LLLGYKPVQHVTVLNTVGNGKYYNIMGPPSYMRSVVDRNVVMRRMTVLDVLIFIDCDILICAMLLSCSWPDGAAVLSRTRGILQSVCTEMCSGMDRKNVMFKCLVMNNKKWQTQAISCEKYISRPIIRVFTDQHTHKSTFHRRSQLWQWRNATQYMSAVRSSADGTGLR